MANSGIKLIKRLPSPVLQLKAIQQEIAKQLKPVGRAHVNEREKVVANFEHQPEFGYEVKISQKQVTLQVLLKNDGEAVSEGFTIGNLWTALDRTGVRPHVIRPKKPGGVLAFQAGYQPKTRPIGRSGGPGRSTGPAVFAKQVNHPGFSPRKFSEKINARLRRQFEQAIDRGVRLGGRKRR